MLVGSICWFIKPWTLWNIKGEACDLCTGVRWDAVCLHGCAPVASSCLGLFIMSWKSDGFWSRQIVAVGSNNVLEPCWIFNKTKSEISIHLKFNPSGKLVEISKTYVGVLASTLIRCQEWQQSWYPLSFMVSVNLCQSSKNCKLLG